MKRHLKRYHRTIFFPKTFEDDVGLLLKIINKKHWLWGFHAVRKLLEVNRKNAGVAEQIVSFVYSYRIVSNSIFEVYYNGDRIEKFCVRNKLYGNQDLILVVSKERTVITFYLNNENDNHDELDESLYEKE